MVNDDGMKLAVSAAAKASWEMLRRDSGEHLNGYALCTDDGLETLYHVASSVERSEASGDSNYPYVPVDWNLDADPSLFREANECLVSRAKQAQGFEGHVRASFESLVEALYQLRKDGTLPPEVILIVTSTDPGPLLAELAEAAVERLNDGRTAARWRKAMG